MPAEPAEPFDGELPLFPLQAVLFPGGLLGLKVFEVRYLDLVTGCLRDRTPFGVVALRAEAPGFEAIGTLAETIDADSERPGILQVRCRGAQRFRIESSRQQADGLWLARTRPLVADDPLAPAEALLGTVRALATTIATLKSKKNEAPFLQPYRFDDAGWVANRWCEILPIPRAAKQKLMELTDPMVRLQLVDEFLRSKGVVT
ncbi:MAG: LON peptidase substrate-binding domain-containing protein [Burkholderiales bacterium]